MLISLSRNQQRVISLCNNDLSVTRSWPFITHHLRCFLTKGRNCYRERAQPPGSGRCQLQRLGRVCRNNSLVPGHPASTASLAQPESHQTRKGFLVSRTWLSMCLKKAMITTAKKKNKPFQLVLIIQRKSFLILVFIYEVTFLSTVWFPVVKG